MIGGIERASAQEPMDEKNYLPGTLESQTRRTSNEVDGGLKVDFEKLIEDARKLEQGLIEAQDELSAAGCLERLDSFPQSEVDKKFRETLDRIARETNALREWQETGTMAAMLEILGDGRFSADIKYVKDFTSIRDWLSLVFFLKNKAGDLLNRSGHKDETSQEKTLMACTRGTKVVVAGKKPTSKELWKALTLRDRDNPIQVLDHELVHVLQNKENRQRFWKDYLLATTLGIGGGFLVNMSIGSGGVIAGNAIQIAILGWRKRRMGRKILLSEIHAYRREGANSASATENSIIDTVNFLKDNYGMKNLDQLIMAATAIDKLRALGASNKEIAKLISGAKWNKENAEWTILEERIRELSELHQLESGDVENLVLADRFERKIENLKAQKIATEALMDLMASDSTKEN